MFASVNMANVCPELVSLPGDKYFFPVNNYFKPGQKYEKVTVSLFNVILFLAYVMISDDSGWRELIRAD